MARPSPMEAVASDRSVTGRNGKSPASPIPEGKEKRLIWRLLNYWEQQRGDRDYPSLADIDPTAIGEIWPYCFLLDVEHYRTFPYFQYLGPSIAKYSGIFLGGQRDWSFTLLKKAVYHFREALERGAPVLVEEELTQYDNRKLLLRSVLLPLSDDQETIDHLLGAAHGVVRED